jgi:NitT/TauT family transport system substrate-binding protein
LSHKSKILIFYLKANSKHCYALPQNKKTKHEENRVMSRLLFLILFGVLSGISPVRKVFAADDTVRLMVAGIQKQIYLPVTLAEQLGYFKEQGIAVELLSEPSGINAEDELLAGAVQGVVGFYDHTIDLQARGRAVQSIVQLMPVSGEVVMVASRMAGKIKSPADFAGTRLGITGLGSSTGSLIRYLSITNGVGNGAFKVVPVGSGDTFIDAIRQGKIDGGMTTEPTVSRLLAAGDAEILIDLRVSEQSQKIFGGPYPASCLYMQTAWISGHRPQVQKLANAIVKALKYIQTHSAENIASYMPESFYGGDKALYVKALAAGKATFSIDGMMPPDGPQTVLKVLSVVNPAVRRKTINLSRTYTTEFAAAAR